VHVSVTKKIRPALRSKVHVNADEFTVNAIRWASHTADQKLVVFQALGYIWVRDSDSGTQRRLTGQSARYEFYPVVSPDGRSVLYTTWNDQELGSVRISDLNGRQSTVITRQPGHYIEPTFSPSGERVVFRKTVGGSLQSPLWAMNPGIYQATADGAQAPELVSTKGTNPHFSATGQRLYFASKTGKLETELNLNSVNLAGDDKREHLHGLKVTQYRVSPDGKWVAFTENYKTYLAPFFSNGKTIKLNGDTKAFSVTQVSARSSEFLSWSADSQALDWSHGRYLYRRELNEAFSFLDGAAGTADSSKALGLNCGHKDLIGCALGHGFCGDNRNLAFYPRV
jgi:Tol biopolymer transport system component